MSVQRLSARFVASAAAPKSGRAEHFDGIIPGLSLRVTERDVKTWSLMYRANGKQRRLKLGRYPFMGLADAREAAQKALATIQRGEDPQQDKERLRSRRASGLTFEALAAEHARERLSKLRTGDEIKRAIERDLVPRWRTKLVEEITRDDVLDAVRSVRNKRTPIAATHILTFSRQFFRWCIIHGLISSNPADGIPAPAKGGERDRVLSDEELAAVLKAAKAIGDPFCGIVELLVFTGARAGEVAALRWQDVAFDEMLWTLSAEQTKAKRAILIPLTKPAVAAIDRQYHLGKRVFGRTKDTPFSAFSKNKSRLDELSGVTDWRLHDIRRTVASGMARLGVPADIISRLLNHSAGRSQGVTAIYNRYAYTEEKRRALNLWAEYVERIVSRTTVYSNRSEETAEVAADR